MNRRLLFSAACAVAILSSCTGSVGAQPGQAVTPPELGDPEFEVVVIAADDLGSLDAALVVDGKSVETVGSAVQPIVW